MIPSHYLATHIRRSLNGYITDYLREEIMNEGLIRNLPAFARFLDAVGYSQAKMINYNNIARDCAIDAKTVKEYYQILIDTLLGYYIWPYTNKQTRDVISATPKFYLFDVGVANFLSKRVITELKGPLAGEAFENYIAMELIAYKGLREREFDIHYWRTKTNLEVDFILGRAEVAIEVKITDSISKHDLKGLIAFIEDHQPQKAYVVCQAPRARKIQINPNCAIHVLPWREFLEKLWHNEII